MTLIPFIRGARVDIDQPYFIVPNTDPNMKKYKEHASYFMFGDIYYEDGVLLNNNYLSYANGNYGQAYLLRDKEKFDKLVYEARYSKILEKLL